MRLGDLDALKEEIMQEVIENRVGVFVAKRIIKLIDNAPTVKIDTNDIEYKAYCKDLEDGKKIARPQGKWVKSKDGYTRCDQCGSRGSAIKARFCHHCGAEMRGKKND